MILEGEAGRREYQDHLVKKTRKLLEDPGMAGPYMNSHRKEDLFVGGSHLILEGPWQFKGWISSLRVGGHEGPR